MVSEVDGWAQGMALDAILRGDTLLVYPLRWLHCTSVLIPGPTMIFAVRFSERYAGLIIDGRLLNLPD
jgi:hypothetical protein